MGSIEQLHQLTTTNNIERLHVIRVDGNNLISKFLICALFSLYTNTFSRSMLFDLHKYEACMKICFDEKRSNFDVAIGLFEFLRAC